MSFKKLCIFSVLLIVTFAGLFCIRKVENKMDNIVDEQRLRFSGDVRNAPPLVAFTSVALGSFRGIIADLLWLRSENLKQEKSYFEMVQLARWITDLQPNYSGGTAYLAWNLAYNISVTCSDYEDRWRWVNEGISLIRDKALLYNPEDPVLYKELAWIFQHKLGNVLDDANLLYKNRLGMQITNILGTGTPDWEVLAAAPKSRDEFLARYPEGHRLWQAARACGYPDYAKLFLAFKNQTPAQLPEALVTQLTAEDFRDVDNFFRAELLRERLKLEPSKILEIDRKYGKMDWRVPESQAIYWATVGIEKTPGKQDLRCARLITQSLQAAFRGGRILSMDDKNLEFIQVVPNLNLADSAYNTYLATQMEYDKGSGAASSFRSARINYLKDAIPLIYTNGNLTKARDFFQKLIKEDGPQRDPKTGIPRSLDEFVMAEFAEDVRDADVKKVSSIISGLIFRSIISLIYGDHDSAVANERLARFIHRKYAKENQDVKRNAIPPYTSMKANVVRDCEMRLPPMMVNVLRAAIAAEQAQAQEERKYNNPAPTEGSSAGEKGRN